ncbi:hypothetical protein GCM10014715_02900 [Streptomyces spiralis]|uniref:Uncharacterized protein n=1 Tax=Streptomyces spiralis TaxID=66376 RepID=A0A918ZJS0_9ACTN|nr:hypothetical protein GCM10014715_02900 [Streptomyces spiralis]
MLVRVSADAHSGSGDRPSDPPQAAWPLSSLGSCAGPEPELWPSQPLIVNPPKPPRRVLPYRRTDFDVIRAIRR